MRVCLSLLLLLSASACRGIGLGEAKSGVEAAANDSTGVGAFYAERDHAPYWTQRPGLREEARALIGQVCQADEHALPPTLFELERLAQTHAVAYDASLPDSLRIPAIGTAEVGISEMLMAYVRALRLGAVRPDTLFDSWNVSRGPLPARALLSQAIDADLADLLNRQAPGHPLYAPLLEAYRRYRTLAASGDWSPLPGAQHAALDSLLTLRLQATGDLDAPADSAAVRPADVRQALRRFQARHALPTSGQLNPATRQALDVPPAERMRTLALNLERLRWLPADRDERFLFSNLRSGRIYGVEGGEYAYTSRTTSAYLQPYADTLRSLTLAPTWFVPASVAADLMSRDALNEAAGFEALQNDLPVPMAGVDQSEVLRGTVRIRQLPGARNYLGGVALRTRPGGNAHVHGQSGAALDPPGIAVWDETGLVAFALGWSAERAAAALRSARAEQTSRVVELDEPLPFFSLYLTAWVDGEGRVQFREDALGLDEALARLLFRAPASDEAVAAACAQLVSAPASAE
jgi:murein L,D-transpeptidase YcbB/YkuD